MADVVINGVGVVSSIGTGKDAFTSALAEDRCGIGVVIILVTEVTHGGYRAESVAKTLHPAALVIDRNQQ